MAHIKKYVKSRFDLSLFLQTPLLGCLGDIPSGLIYVGCGALYRGCVGIPNELTKSTEHSSTLQATLCAIKQRPHDSYTGP